VLAVLAHTLAHSAGSRALESRLFFGLVWLPSLRLLLTVSYACPCSSTLPPRLDQEASRSHRAVCVRLQERRIAWPNMYESSGVSLARKDIGIFVRSSAGGESVVEVVQDGGRKSSNRTCDMAGSFVSICLLTQLLTSTHSTFATQTSRDAAPYLTREMFSY
jgi:hypothetical protein